MRFWRNPEFVRHVRAGLRPTRALTVAVLVLVICALVGLSAWGAERHNLREFFKAFYLWLLGIQYVVLGFWCASGCGQAIARERELKTYDFLKTTRLTSAELMVGKLLGVPVVAYFAVGCSLPVSLVTGLFAGYSLATLGWSYLLLLVFALFVSLLGLLGSMLVEKSSAGAVGLLGLLPVAFAFGFAGSPFPGFGAISIFPAIFSIYGADLDMARVRPTLFGLPVSFVFLTLLLYAAFGAWFILMLRRNLKRDREQVRLLSRWQAIGFAAFLNLLFYAFLDPQRVGSNLGIRPQEVSYLAVGLNAFILFVIGIAMLTPAEKLKVWWRKREVGEEDYLSESGLPWPWLIPAAAIAYAFLAAEATGLRGTIPFEQWSLGTAAIQLLVFLAFITRDVLFLQWCNLTRMKRPVVKGFLYLWLYYTAAGILAAVVSIASSSRGRFLLGLLTPYDVYNAEGIRPGVAPGIYAGLVLQIAVIGFLLHRLTIRLQRPATVAAASAASRERARL